MLLKNTGFCYLTTLVILTAYIPTIKSQCPTGYTYNSMLQQCLRLVANPVMNLTYAQAMATCAQDSAVIGTPRNAAENTFYLSLRAGITGTTTGLWLYLGAMYSSDSFRFPDGTALSYTNFFHTITPQSENACAAMNTAGRWLNIPCASNIFAFTCVLPVPCPANYQFIPSIELCSREFQNSRRNYQEAITACDDDGARLATAQTAAQNAYLYSIEPIPANPRVNRLIWIGLMRIAGTPNSYIWTDSTMLEPGDFNSWADGFPGTDPDRACIMIDQAGNWRNFGCTQNALSHACYIDP